MRLSCGLMSGQRWEASLAKSPEHPDGSRQVVVLENEEVLLPADAEFGSFSIVEATTEERGALQASGYIMPDWSPEMDQDGAMTLHQISDPKATLH